MFSKMYQFTPRHVRVIFSSVVLPIHDIVKNVKIYPFDGLGMVFYLFKGSLYS